MSAIMPKPSPGVTIQLEFVGDVGPNRELLVEVRNKETREVLMCESLRQTAQWLKALGYTYATGSSGVWQKPA